MKKEIIFRVIIAFFIISITWFVYKVTAYINDDLLQIEIYDLRILILKSLLIGVLLSLPFGLLKYFDRTKSQ